MKTQIRLFSPLMIESTEENLRNEYEKKLGRLPLWWYPCAAIAFTIPIMTLFLIILT